MKNFPQNIEILIEVEDGVFECYRLCPERSNPLSLLTPYLRNIIEGKFLHVMFRKVENIIDEEK